jgi:hypothetical protein
MIKDTLLIDEIIYKIEATNRADLIKSALNKDVNSSVVESDYQDKVLKSDERFEKARAKFEEEKEIYDASNEKNAKEVLEKHIKVISNKLESLGF